MVSSGIAAGVVSLFYQADQAKESSSRITNAMLATYVELARLQAPHLLAELGLIFSNLSVIECCIILIVSCAPSLRLLWTQYLKKSAFFVRLGLDGTHPTSGNSKKSYHPTSPSYQFESNNSARPIRVETHHYVELNDIAKPHLPAYEATASRGQATNV